MTKPTYRLVRVPDHPRASPIGQVLEHIVVVETVLGHYLPKEAEVHHVNGIGKDNRKKNLVVCQDHQYHMLLHQRQRALRACGNPSLRRCMRCQKYDDPTLMGHHGKGSLVHLACRQEYRLKWERTVQERRGRDRRQGPRRREPEHEAQVALFHMAKLYQEKVPELGFLYAVPNGRFRHISEGVKLKAEGVKPGYPDVGLDVAQSVLADLRYAPVLYHGLRIEMKAPGQRRTVSDAQLTWHIFLKAQGYRVVVCDTWQEAWNEVVRYLNHPELMQPEAP